VQIPTAGPGFLQDSVSPANVIVAIGCGSRLSVSKRNRPAQSDGEVLRALALLATRRGPYADLVAAIVAETLERFPPLEGKSVVEIGAGTGQLRAWLPAAVRARTIHTDPSGRALSLLRKADPEAQTRVAPAQRLPFDHGACGGVIGLCVFDAVVQALAGQTTPALQEIARVLGPGGRFVHFMDMATLLEGPFEKLAASGLVPIPNVFGDPADSEWPLDVVLLQRDWLAALLDFATRTGHPLAAAFGRFFGVFLTSRLDVEPATRLFQSIGSSGESRHALLTQLVSACQLSIQHGLPPLKPLPFHSGRYLLSVLETAFRESEAFEIERAQIVARSAWRQRAAGSTVHYRSLCLGHERIFDELPRRLLTESAATRTPSEGAPDDQVLVEAGVFVFVARRL
jgi:SAM-dependent methyltransferase